MREYYELEFLGLNFIRKNKIYKEAELLSQEKVNQSKKENK